MVWNPSFVTMLVSTYADDYRTGSLLYTMNLNGRRTIGGCRPANVWICSCFLFIYIEICFFHGSHSWNSIFIWLLYHCASALKLLETLVWYIVSPFIELQHVFFYYDLWKRSCSSWYGKYPIIYRIFYIPGGAGFLPSTVFIHCLSMYRTHEYYALGGHCNHCCFMSPLATAIVHVGSSDLWNERFLPKTFGILRCFAGCKQQVQHQTCMETKQLRAFLVLC